MEESSDEGQDHVWVCFVEILKPPDACTSKVVVLVGDLSNTQYHDDEHGDLYDVVEVESDQVCISLLCVVIDC